MFSLVVKRIIAIALQEVIVKICQNSCHIRQHPEQLSI